MRITFKILLFMVASFCLLPKIQAKPVLSTLFSNNMVLQQKCNAPIWGTAIPKKNVRIITSWNNVVTEVKADSEGAWKTSIATPSAGGPYEIKISDGTEIRLSNIMIGEVWICSGQSNMEMPLGGWGKVLNYREEIAKASYPSIRLLQIKKTTSAVPSDVVTANSESWNVCTPVSVENFSAVAYFYARELNRKLNIPIGVIDVTWGGTPIEAWMSGDALNYFSEFDNKMQAAYQANNDKELALKIEETNKNAWIKQCENLDKGLIGFWYSEKYNFSTWDSMPIPQYMEKTLRDDFDGIVWFKKSLSIPNNWFAKGDVSLELGPIDDEDVCYFNGIEIGRTSGYDVDRHYIIPQKIVKSGLNVLTVRVYDSGGGGGIYGKPEQLYLKQGNKKIELCGEWKYKIGANQRQLPTFPMPILNNSSYPASLYNAMIHPLIPFAMRGVIWYQGEANENRGYQYRDLFLVLIRNWRDAWKRVFPFYFVQLANYKKSVEKPAESSWAEVREAQDRALCLEQTGMAVITDIGEESNIHFKNKQEVGRRLSLIALSNTYGINLEYSGPRYSSFCIKDNKVELQFTHAKGLMSNGGMLRGFAVAGPDHIYYNADAKILGNVVTVFSPLVKYPVAVRYDWADNPESLLFNSNSLPAAPFRTDDWLGVTYNCK